MSSTAQKDPLALLNDFLNEDSENDEENRTEVGRTNKPNNTRFYDLLGVAFNASKEEIKRAYRSKARVLHPDRNKTMSQEEAESAFHDLTFAYETLKDDELRNIYDQFGETAIDGKLKIDITKINLMELFDTLYDENDEKNDQIKPPKCVVFVRYDENDLRKGAKDIEFERNNICEACQGSCKYGYTTCVVCNGNGFISVNERLRINILQRAVSERDYEITRKLEGHRMPPYSEPGDLEIRLMYRPMSRSHLQKKQKKNSHGQEITLTISYIEAYYDGVNRIVKLQNGEKVHVFKKAPVKLGNKVIVPVGSSRNNKNVCVIFNVPNFDLNDFFESNAFQMDQVNRQFLMRLDKYAFEKMQYSDQNINGSNVSLSEESESNKPKPWLQFWKL